MELRHILFVLGADSVICLKKTFLICMKIYER